MKKVMGILAVVALMAAMVTGCGTNGDVAKDNAVT